MVIPAIADEVADECIKWHCNEDFVLEQVKGKSIIGLSATDDKTLFYLKPGKTSVS
jgi:hypothetical protein